MHVKKLKTPANSSVNSLIIGEYRVMMSIKDLKLIILVLGAAGNRSKVYKKF
ncbi:hypothetical protein MmTuc01_3456 [Methanosarcina mazei Tuc01]|uniref:Uncharacterized protein n=1 Tax=Methanosarcina mazei Tuc01 TaxID=1236903 RepID=M1Q8K8_METMZ|nr:hypothetical protein MmTuc01_3456 [Methanosarcina mazei Tuc01]